MEKECSRRECLSRVRSLSPLQRNEFSSAICEAISSNSAFRNSGTIFAYSALPEEPDLARLIAYHPEKHWAFPKTSTDGMLSFFLARSSSGMPRGQFGIREPDPALHTRIPFVSADLILVPGLGFDPLSGARLGRGKGYYDRFLGSFSGAGSDELRPLTVGVCFSTQFTKLVPEPHDVPMHVLISELGWHNPA